MTLFSWGDMYSVIITRVVGKRMAVWQITVILFEAAYFSMFK